MWPFSNKKRSKSEPEIAFETVLCIPGNWRDREDFILSIVDATQGEYIAAGNILINAKSERHFTLDFCDYDQRMGVAFNYAGQANRVSDSFIEEIKNHKHVVYLIGTGGSLLEAEHIARAGLAILKSGGLGIMVETAGKAFEKWQWEACFKDFEIANLYEMFVIESIHDESNNFAFSCGMQNLGLRDTIVIDEEFQDAADLIRIFNIYQIVDKPTILHNQTFTPIINSSMFRISNETDQPYKGVEMFENPYGMWKLSRI